MPRGKPGVTFAARAPASLRAPPRQLGDSHRPAQPTLRACNFPWRTSMAAEREAAVPHGIITAHPIFVPRAQGAYVWDEDGKRYLDFVGGLGVLNVGHNHPRQSLASNQRLRALASFRAEPGLRC